jgi:hypothetical protein
VADASGLTDADWAELNKHREASIACLRWIENPRDRVSGFRVVRLIPGVGAKTATRILIVRRYAIAHQAVRSWKSV